MSAHASPRRIGLAALLLVPLLLVGGCTAAVEGGLVPGASTGEARTQPASGDAGAPMAPTDTTGAGAQSADRQVAKSASLTVTVPDLLAAADGVRQAAVVLGGWVVQEDLQLSAEPGWRTTSIVTVSVPADQLDAALERLSQLGTVTQRSTSAVDVTEPVEDTEARIRTLEASIARVSELMTRAGTVAEIAQVERELSVRQAELESLKAERERLRTAVERATVSVMLQTPEQSVTTNPFLVGLARGWEAFLASIALLLTMLGGLLPFALLAVLAAVPLMWWWRRRSAGRAPAGAARANGANDQEPPASDDDRPEAGQDH